MTIKFPVILAILTVGFAAVGRAQEEPAPVAENVGEADVAPVEEVAGENAPAEEPAPDADALVQALGAEAYKDREAASKALWSLGEMALELLNAAQDSDDPEIVFRARHLVRRIQTGITPETPQEIVDLVEKYYRGDPDDKRVALDDLRKKTAFAQVLRLNRFEVDPEALEECEEVVEEAVEEALDQLTKLEEWDDVREVLSLAPVNPVNLQRRAAFSRFRGELDADLKAATRAGDRELELALMRAKGDVAGALALAKTLGRRELVAGLSLFEGNPVPYFDWVIENQNFSAIMRLSAEIARNRWMGDETEAARLAQALVDEERGNDSYDPRSLAALMLNGYWDDVKSLMEGRREYADHLFAYYELVEQPDRAIAIHGYKGTPEEKAAWVDAHMAEFAKSPTKAIDERSLLLTVAGFLVDRGERETGFDIVRRMGRLVEKRGGKQDWLRFVGIVGDQGGINYELALVVAQDAMPEGNEEAHVAQVMATMLRKTDVAMRHWERLKAEEEDPRQRLLLLGAVYGMVEMEAARVDPVLNRLFTKAVTAEGLERRQSLADLVEPAAYRDDTNDVRELLVMLSEIDGIEGWTHQLAIYHSCMSDWDAAAQAFEAELRLRSENREAVASLAATYVRMGQRDKARALLATPEMCTFDDTDDLLGLAQVFTSYNIREDAEIYLKLFLTTTDPRERRWVSAGEEFARHAKRRGDWRVAAAFMEVDAVFDVRDRPTETIPLMFLRKRFGADLMRGLALHQEGRAEAAVALFDRSFQFLVGDGILADDFFPLLREAGLTEAHDRYFEICWARIMKSIEAYPATHNTYNNAAWHASRAVRRLDEAEALEAKALAMRPKQAAYLDTMAEVWFARGNREKAVEWSRKAVMDSENARHSGIGGSELRGQLERFKSDPFPVP